MKERRMKRMAKDSILPESEWYEVSRIHPGMHKHHVIPGRELRELCEKYGLYVYFEPDAHNLSSDGVHFNKELMDELRQAGQKAFEEHYPELNFYRIFGQNFIDGREFSHDELFGLLYRGCANG